MLSTQATAETRKKGKKDAAFSSFPQSHALGQVDRHGNHTGGATAIGQKVLGQTRRDRECARAANEHEAAATRMRAEWAVSTTTKQKIIRRLNKQYSSTYFLNDQKME